MDVHNDNELLGHAGTFPCGIFRLLQTKKVLCYWHSLQDLFYSVGRSFCLCPFYSRTDVFRVCNAGTEISFHRHLLCNRNTHLGACCACHHDHILSRQVPAREEQIAGSIPCSRTRIHRPVQKAAGRDQGLQTRYQEQSGHDSDDARERQCRRRKSPYSRHVRQRRFLLA